MKKSKSDVIQELILVDLAFCEECKVNGADGWIKYVSENSIMVSGGHNANIGGKDNIYGIMVKVFDWDNIDFIWKPLNSDVSDDFTMGYTMGEYTRKYLREDREIVEKGKYTTIWKKIDGMWKIVLDIGN